MHGRKARHQLYSRSVVARRRHQTSCPHSAAIRAERQRMGLLVQSNKLFLIGHKMTTNDLVAINTRNCLQLGKIYINLDNGKLKVY